MERQQLEIELARILSPNRFKDYAPNGLQVEGKVDIQRIVTGVTACQALIDEAIKRKADALLVHHGYFWKGESAQITGMKYRRISALIKNDINLFGYHLPLDAHPILGNNAQLADILRLQNREALQSGIELADSIGLVGYLSQAASINEIKDILEKALGRAVLVEASGPDKIAKIALCSGGAQGFIEQACEVGADLYLTGEVSEQTIHFARENRIHFVAAGHHATERYGVKALGKHLASQFGLDVMFVDIGNPA